MSNANYFQVSICFDCKHDYWKLGMKYTKCLIKDKPLNEFICSCDDYEPREVEDEQSLTT